MCVLVIAVKQEPSSEQPPVENLCMYLYIMSEAIIFSRKSKTRILWGIFFPTPCLLYTLVSIHNKDRFSIWPKPFTILCLVLLFCHYSGTISNWRDTLCDCLVLVSLILLLLVCLLSVCLAGWLAGCPNSQQFFRLTKLKVMTGRHQLMCSEE